MDAVIRDRNSSSCFHPVSSASHKINDPIVKEFLCQPIHISPCIADLEVGSRCQTLLKDKDRRERENAGREFLREGTVVMGQHLHHKVQMTG